MTAQGARLEEKEPYWQGVRRRLREASVITVAGGVSCLLAYAVYELSHALPLTLMASVLCGIVSERAVMSILPLPAASDFSKNQKGLWLALFVPCFIALTSVLIYSAMREVHGTDLLGAVLVAWLLGNMSAATYRVLRW